MENTPITTTLNDAYKQLGLDWTIQLLKFLGKTKLDDDPLKFSTIADAIGMGGARKALQALYERNTEYDVIISLFIRDIISRAETKALYYTAYADRPSFLKGLENEFEAQKAILIKHFG